MAISPYSQAVLDYYNYQPRVRLLIDTSYGMQEEMPLEVLFRNEEDCSPLETYAMNLCRGRVLDIGAGVGASSLILQKRGLDVTALEVEATLADIMVKRGVKKVVCSSIFNYNEKGFDTILMMMNGLGLVGTIKGLNTFLEHAKQLVSPSGQILLDSSDISYFYEGKTRPDTNYFGEIGYRFQYKDRKGEWFSWLYIDPEKLQEIARDHGWYAQILYVDETDQYLARLILADTIDESL